MRKLVSIILALLLFVSMFPIACADGIDLYFKGMVARSKAQGVESMEMTYKRAGSLVFLNFSIDGFQAIADLADSGDKDYLDLWNEVGKAMVEELQPILDEARSYGNECNIIYTLLSDTDPGTILVSVTEGEILYDYVNGTYSMLQIAD